MKLRHRWWIARILPFAALWYPFPVVLLCTWLSVVAAYSSYSSSSSSSSSYSSSSSSSNTDSSINCPTALSLCANSVIQVRDVQWVCNSPYAYYWGSGTHRNSRVCAHSDKITYQVTFRVTDDITEVADVYVSMAIQEYSSRIILQSKSPSYLCSNYVGTDCTKAGEYSFGFTLRLDTSANNSYNINNSNNYNAGGGADSSSSSSSSSSITDDFCPVLILAFSTEEDSGYNLGALNMECEAWDNALVTWKWASQERPKLTPREWIRNYGMIMGTGLCLIVFSSFLWQQARRVKTTFGPCVNPCIMELDEYYNYQCPPTNPLPPPPQQQRSIPNTIAITQQEQLSSSSSPPPLQQHPSLNSSLSTPLHPPTSRIPPTSSIQAPSI